MCLEAWVSAPHASLTSSISICPRVNTYVSMFDADAGKLGIDQVIFGSNTLAAGADLQLECCLPPEWPTAT